MVMASAIRRPVVGLDWNSLKILYISGVPYDAAHGLATAFFLFLFGDKVIRKIERAKLNMGCTDKRMIVSERNDRRMKPEALPPFLFGTDIVLRYEKFDSNSFFRKAAGVKQFSAQRGIQRGFICGIQF